MLVATCDVRTLKDPDVAPAGTVTLVTVGAATVVLLPESDTTMPPAGAAHSSVNVACTVAPPLAGFGDSDSVRTLIGRTVKVNVFEAPA